jgi:tryptophan synthase alpha chain
VTGPTTDAVTPTGSPSGLSSGVSAAPPGSGVAKLDELFAGTRAEGRAALIGYLPAGYPTVPGSLGLLTQTLDAGADLVEVGLPYSDPVLDGPVIQQAVDRALAGGVRIRDTLHVVEQLASRGGRAVVMTYWNPVMRYGVDAFARDLAAAGGLGVITPDLVPDEAAVWLTAAGREGLAPIFLVAPSSSEERIAATARATRGFLYAASTMGVTGARDAVSGTASELVSRVRAHTDLPVGVGLGVRSGAQAGEVAAFADGVIVGSALVSAAEHGRAAVARLTSELAAGVRGNHTGR